MRLARMPSDRAVEATAWIGRRREGVTMADEAGSDDDRIAGRTYDSRSSGRSWPRRPTNADSGHHERRF
jgi:hypothetical protein